MRVHLKLGIAVLCAVMWMPARGSACSCVAEVFNQTQPLDGAQGVPLDFVPIFDGFFDPASFSFEDDQGGKVEFTLDVSPGFAAVCPTQSAELRPKNLLRPGTRYTIRANAQFPNSGTLTDAVSFTTGSATAVPLALDTPQLEKATVVRGALDCGGLRTAMVCISGLAEKEPHDHELIARSGETILMRITTLIQDDGTYGLPGVPDCIELRRRAANGKRSEARKICGAALTVVDWPESAGPEQVPNCVGGVVALPPVASAPVDAGTPQVASAAGTPAARAITTPAPAPPQPMSSGCAVAPTPLAESDFDLLLTLGLCAMCFLARTPRAPRSWPAA